MKSIIYIAIGGATGAVLRYGFGLILKPTNSLSFPINTFLINVIGCLLIGIVAAYAIKVNQNQLLTQFVIIGLLGGFTTFSSFSLETVNLLKNGKTTLALAYILASNVVGIFATLVGFQIHKVIEKA